MQNLDELFERQNFIINEINKIYINFKKDPSERKTAPEYFRKRLEAIDNLWNEFELNNSHLHQAEDKSSEYFVKDIYNQWKEFYQTARINLETGAKLISAKMQQKEQPNKPSTSFFVPPIEKAVSTSEEQMEDLMAQQFANFLAMTRQMTRIIDDNIEEKWEIEDELKNLQHRWRIIDNLHLRIDSLVAGVNEVYNQEFAKIESRYSDIKRKLNRKLGSTAHLQQSLPKIEIPVFTGKYTQWPTFCDLYSETIHNNKYLTNAQRMQYLKSHLKGEAERLIQHLHITAENYETAWSILEHRYNNPQLIFTKQIEILLNQPNIHKQSSYELKKLHDTTTETIHAIHNLGVNTNTWDPLLVHLLSKKLDADTYSDYKEYRKEPKELPSLNEFMTFIEIKFTALEPIQRREKETPSANKTMHYTPPTYQNKPPTFNNRPSTSAQGYQNSYQNKPYRKGFYQAAPTYYARRPCVVCNAFHDLFMCKVFLSLSAKEQLETISMHKICQNCLYKHYDKPCNSDRTCKECNEKHNTLIHDAIIQSKIKPKQLTHISQSTATGSSSSALATGGNTAKPPRQHHANYVATDEEEILLTTITIKVKAADNTYVTFRALLDQGSQVSLISENAAQLLGLQRKRYHASVAGIGPGSKQSKGIVTLECQSIYDDYQFSTQALIITRVINNLPNTTFKDKSWEHVQHIKLADPEYNVSKPIDLLLDASVYSDIIMEGLIKGPPHAPIAQQTKLGWILSGNVKTFNCNVIINQVDDLSKYWEMEDIPESCEQTTLTEQEQYCENLYQQTTRVLDNGKYEVALPMKPGYEQDIGQSKYIAISRFLQIERKITKNPSLSEAYKKFIIEYQQLGHMRAVDDGYVTARASETACYLPHHGVLKTDSTTTALRVVFNASSKTSSGRSLNDLMESGPNLQQDLQTLIIKWREHKYVMTADIEKMFRQILIRTSDQPLQSIVWRDSPNDLIQQYHLTTVTYGTKAAPFLAMRTLRQIAKDNSNQFKLAAHALQNSFYMDDLMCGHDNIDEAKVLQRELITVLKNAGMNLRKWSSNEPELIRDLTPEMLSTMYDFKDTETRKTLGLRWNPATDTFTYQSKITEINEKDITKRQLLSEISKTYDPLGWLSPITIRGKLLFQKTWVSDLSWDDKLSKIIQREWKELQKDLMFIDTFQIPRYLGQAGRSLQIHGFCDASEKAYACAVYFVAKNNKGGFTSKLVAAKTKVAPTKKQVSLPRLELLGAVLLSQLMKKVRFTLSSSTITYAWTDSMIVLGWIHGDILKWKQFISNRVQKITEVLPPSCWRHVKSDENAADCATRGMTSTNLSKHSLWWEGPKFILNYQPTEKSTYKEPNIEIKKTHNVVAALHSPSESLIIKLLNEMSSITQIAKIIAWVTRFMARLRRTAKHEATYQRILSPTEVHNALNLIIKTVQQVEFPHELTTLKNSGHIKPSSKLISLHPYLDDDGLLRVGGRLENSNLRYSAKHPIILPKSSRLTELIVDQAHITTLHGGPKLTLSYIRDTYWIISGLSSVKKQLRNCIKCRRYKQTSQYQVMADLPQPRVTPSRPFTNTGVDFTGHVDIKLNKGRGVRTNKGYVAVFVCLVTKAVHLELVSDLSSEAFLPAFRRMCSRRGTPKNVYSDNGTNFVGASRFLERENQEIIKTINEGFINKISDIGVTWHFNAPAWPTAGGLWEAAVKSLKYHLKRVMGDQKLTYEEMITLLHQIEACLNSRPLCVLTENPEDDCLTPGHFLVGGSLISRPQTDPDTIPLSSRWQLVQNINKQIWKRWSSEYLQQLQTRTKWQTITEDLKINDVVVIKEDNMPPGKWALARVCETHPGKDGHTRVVSLKTQNNITKRPINKLIPLPVHKTYEENEQPQQADITNATRRLRPRKNIPKSFFITALLLIMSFIPSSLQQSIPPIRNNNSLYFDHTSEMQIIKDQWTMVIYLNMTTYWQSVENIENYISKLVSWKNESEICTTILSQYQHQLKEIQHLNNLLRPIHHRRKRGLVNAIGNVANALFGVLDDKFANQYKQDIDTLHENELHLLNLLKNQTSIIEAHNNILHRNEQQMNRQFDALNYQLQTIMNEANIIRKSYYLLSNALLIGAMISNIQRIQQSLINSVTDLYQGRLDVHIITPEQLQEQINIISGHVSGDLLVPIKSENVNHLYEILHVKAKINHNYLIIEVKIPLTTNEIYQLDHVISLPQEFGNKTIYAIPATEYIAFNMRKDTFIPMTQTDILSCMKYHQDRLLCGINAPLYELKMEQSICDIRIVTKESNQTFCKIKSIECTDVWIKLHNNNAWLYSCCEHCNIRIMCPASLTSQRINGNGIIALDQGCAVKGDTFSLFGHHNYHNKLNIEQIAIQNVDVPSLNELINTTIPINTLRTIEPKDDVYDNLNEQIQIIKEATINNVPEHDKHQYIMIYVLMTICLVLVVCTIYLFYFLRKRGLAKTNNQEQRRVKNFETSTDHTDNIRIPKQHVYPKPEGGTRTKLESKTTQGRTMTLPNFGVFMTEEDSA